MPFASKATTDPAVQARLDDPAKHWKYDPGDIDDRELWDEYMEAYRIAIAETDTEHAPWYIVPANRKWYSRIAVQELLITALEALDLVRSQPFDMVFCDVGMPGKNGLDLCTELRAEGVDSKLVLITGWDGAQIRGDDRFASCDDILQKPFVGTDIIDVVTRMFPDVAH